LLERCRDYENMQIKHYVTQILGEEESIRHDS